jgi:hypothetical protein
MLPVVESRQATLYRVEEEGAETPSTHSDEKPVLNLENDRLAIPWSAARFLERVRNRLGARKDVGVSIATRKAPIAPRLGPEKRGAGAGDAGFGVEGSQNRRRARKAKPSRRSKVDLIN